MPKSGESVQSVLVACALISIALNPLFFRSRGTIEDWLGRRPGLWRLLSRRSEARGRRVTERTAQALASEESRVQAVVVGYGPVGRTVRRILSEFDIKTVVIDLNVDTVRDLERAKAPAVYGDARRRDILEAARVQGARYLLITLPDVATRLPVISAAKELNRDLRIFVRARYLAEQSHLELQGATAVCYEEGEAAVALAQLLLREVGAAPERIQEEAERIRAEFSGGAPVTPGL
jgi:CPA2 family monovalent cation:H+ antiporter-2